MLHVLPQPERTDRICGYVGIIPFLPQACDSGIMGACGLGRWVGAPLVPGTALQRGTTLLCRSAEVHSMEGREAEWLSSL